MSEKLTRLVVAIEAQNTQFIKELKRSQKETAYFKKQVQSSLNGVAASSGKSTAVVRSNFRAMRGSFGQLGYQIQDVAVQLQTGQNAMLVFGQQGSQIASIFGPGGAVAGAFLAVGAAIGTAFLPKLFQTKETTEDLVKKIKELNKEYDTLGTAQRGLLTKQETDAIEEQNRVIEESRAKIERLTAQQEALAQAQNTQLTGLASFAPGFADIYSGLERGAKNAAEQQLELSAAIETATQSITEAEAEIERINSGANKEREKTIENMISSLAKEAATYNYTATQLALYEAGLAGANEEELKRIATLRQMIDTQDELKKAAEEKRKEDEKQQKNLRKAQFREVDSIMRVGIGGFDSGAKDEVPDKLDTTNQRLSQIYEVMLNGRAITI